MGKKFNIMISLLYIVFMASWSIYFYTNSQSFELMVSIAGVLCGTVPILLLFLMKNQLNCVLVTAYYLFLFSSQYLGSIKGWYTISWWDTCLHGMSGVILGCTAVALYNYFVPLNGGSSFFLFLFAFSFAALGGVMWEIFEFSMDQFMGLTTQSGGNTDTMMDLIADTVGGLLIAVWAGWGRKRTKSTLS